VTAGYSGTPLPRKLGVKAESRVLLVAAPPGFTLDGVAVHTRRGRDPYDVIVLFCSDARTLRSRFTDLTGALTTAGALWACWPKKASGVVTDLGEKLVREHGLDVGLVDVKVVAVDATWSGLKFVRRVADR
jgi:hypothetical protein